MSASTNWPSQGCGVGLRNKHYQFILSDWPKMDWFEAVTENFLDTGGRPLNVLQEIRRHYPVALHGVSLSIGTCDALDKDYLKKLKELVSRIEPFVVSDHLCWTGVEGENLHDLLPLPFTEEAMKHVTRRVNEVQEFLGRPILLENISTYVTYKHSQVPEWDFLREVARKSGCGILLDLNNIFVNATNHRFDPFRYLEAIPASSVGQFHLAGHTDKGDYLFDTHSAPVVPNVWKLYEQALRLYGPVSTLIEWDEEIPDFSRLSDEVEMARRIYEKSRPDKPAEAPAVPLYFPENSSVARLSLLSVQHEMKMSVKARRDGTMSADLLNPQGGLPGAERMAVYAEGYVVRLSEALAEVYETINHLLGKEAFMELAGLYLEHFPSHNYNLNCIGKELPGFIGKTRFTNEFPFLPDLASLELAVVSAFHAFDETPFDPAVLVSLSEEDWEKMRVIFQPSVHVVGSDWPILDIWKARKTPLSEMNIDLINRPQSVLVYRQGVEVCCEAIDKSQKDLVQHLLKGISLGETCASVAEVANSEELPLEQWFSSWTGQGLIAHVACDSHG
jgi:uncharacterized protein (UPF0276 family)